MSAIPETAKYQIVVKSVPTFYFIGVTTGKSSIMKVFPLWAIELGRPEIVMEGIDLKMHDQPDNYRQATAQIKYDPLSLGALATTHKIDLLEAARDMFDYREPRGDDARHLRQHPAEEPPRPRNGRGVDDVPARRGDDDDLRRGDAVRLAGCAAADPRGEGVRLRLLPRLGRKGTAGLLGVRAVVAESFERIHRSNLVGMGILPLQLVDGATRESLGLTGKEAYSVEGVAAGISPGMRVTVRVSGEGGERTFPALARIDTPAEVHYYRHGGILPFVLRRLIGKG